jgi:hypothetical protein
VSWAGCLSSCRALIKLSLVEFVWCSQTVRVMSWWLKQSRCDRDLLDSAWVHTVCLFPCLLCFQLPQAYLWHRLSWMSSKQLRADSSVELHWSSCKLMEAFKYITNIQM